MKWVETWSGGSWLLLHGPYEEMVGKVWRRSENEFWAGIKMVVHPYGYHGKTFGTLREAMDFIEQNYDLLGCIPMETHPPTRHTQRARQLRIDGL